MNKITKNILIAVVALILVAGAVFIFRDQIFSKDKNNTMNTQADNNTEAVIFTRNITFKVPDNALINMDTSANSVLVLDKSTQKTNFNNYQELLAGNVIIIQSFPPLNKNKEIFTNYVNQRYKSNDKITSTIEFTTVNGREAAIVNIVHPADKYVEYAEVINLDNPVIVVAAKKSENFQSIVSSIKNTDNANPEAALIRKQIQLIGTLLKNNMTQDLYSQFSTEAKKNVSQSDLKSNLEVSKETIKKVITVNGGLWIKSKNQFVSKILFREAQKDTKAGQLILTKEKGKWLISALDIPKD